MRCPFIEFSQFTNQMQHARVSTVLNERAVKVAAAGQPLKTGNVAWSTGYDRNARVPAVPRCQAMGETGLHIDPSCQDAHIQNFLDCVRSRKRPVADVEIGYRSVSPCLVGVIAYGSGAR